VLVSQSPTKYDDRLHTLDLPLNNWVQVFFARGWEGKEMDGAKIVTHLKTGSFFGQERSERLVDVLGQKWCEGGLQAHEIFSVFNKVIS
jgi:hypothetical protein